MAFLRMDNPGKKELVACVKETTLALSRKVRGKKTTCNFMNVLHERSVQRSLAQADPQTGYRDPVTGVRRIEVKGRKKGHPIRLTTNEWFKATQLGDSYWLYVVWDPLENPNDEPVRIQNLARKLDHVKREVVTARFFEIPAEAIAQMDERS